MLVPYSYLSLDLSLDSDSLRGLIANVCILYTFYCFVIVSSDISLKTSYYAGFWSFHSTISTAMELIILTKLCRWGVLEDNRLGRGDDAHCIAGLQYTLFNVHFKGQWSWSFWQNFLSCVYLNTAITTLGLTSCHSFYHGSWIEDWTLNLDKSWL